MSLHIITHVVPYLRSIMHMHFYCYLAGGTAYLLDRETEWCYSGIEQPPKEQALAGFIQDSS